MTGTVRNWRDFSDFLQTENFSDGWTRSVVIEVPAGQFVATLRPRGAERVHATPPARVDLDEARS